jgi:hypothetical protein
VVICADLGGQRSCVSLAGLGVIAPDKRPSVADATS